MVKISELNNTMIIQSFVQFSNHYQTMSEQTCDWVKHNFKGAQAVVLRDGKLVKAAVDQIRAGDTLSQLYKLPPALKKLTIVNEKLTKALKNRGFLVFKVTEIHRQKSAGQEQRKRSISLTQDFTQQVGEGAKIRDEAAAEVEKLMDNTRGGTINIVGVMDYVSSITEDSSTEVISAVAGLKESDHTYAHCVDVGAIFQSAYTKIIHRKKAKSKFKDEYEMLLGAFLHDFGKAKIPKDILESNERFEPDSKEMRLIRKHPEYSVELLNKMMMPDYIINMAHYHHVKLDRELPSSYPKINGNDPLPMETQLLSIVDIYQALVGRRRYKKSWAAPAAMRYIDQLAGVEYPQEVWNDFFQVMGRFPIGSLVQLNDGSQAFVTNVPEKDLNKPQVVIVKNAKGERLTHQTFADLQVEKDLSIKKELDNYDAFDEDPLDIFTNLRIS
ncbi:HD domain-containing protein [bacterium]|nr:HD domain-containing protein [bacterium]